LIEILAQIEGPAPRRFNAGLVLWDDVVVEAAPIIGYMKRGSWTRDRVRRYCELRGWDAISSREACARSECRCSDDEEMPAMWL
jgi:hypothetical protein